VQGGGGRDDADRRPSVQSSTVVGSVQCRPQNKRNANIPKK
jgi:hypothetical protein